MVYGAIARLAASAVASAIGSTALSAIGDAIAGSPTENEARQKVAPLFNREVAKLMAGGLSFADAESQANEAVAGHVKQEMETSNLPEWASGILGVVGGIGGWALGAKLAGKGLAKVASAKLGSSAPKAASMADAAIEDPVKKAAATAVGDVGQAVEGAASRGVSEFEHIPKVMHPFPGALSPIGSL